METSLSFASKYKLSEAPQDKVRVAGTCLGCKVNQVETFSLLEAWAQKGAQIVPFKAQADIYLVNTCAVTARAAYESRQLLRRALKKNPLLVVATGCYVQVSPEEILERVGAPLLLVGNALKENIPHIVEKLTLPLSEPVVLREDVSQLTKCGLFPLSFFPGHARAFLRIQEGCNAFCTYCIVPHARGPARSLLPEEVVSQALRFVNAGHKEIVLTGTHLGLWGKDLSAGQGLIQLLRVLEKKVPVRLRLSSLEPPEVTQELLTWAVSSPKFCPHFHLSLQSGDEEVLKAMGRRYTAWEVRDLVYDIKKLFPQAAIGMDVIVGFPKEDEEAFGRTVALLEDLPISYLHVFRYSPRPFTPAARWRQIPPDKIAARAKRLQGLSRAKFKAFMVENLGRVLQVLVQKRDKNTGLWQGISENYLSVLFAGPPDLQNKIVSVRLARVVNNKAYGVLERG